MAYLIFFNILFPVDRFVRLGEIEEEKTAAPTGEQEVCAKRVQERRMEVFLKLWIDR